MPFGRATYLGLDRDALPWARHTPALRIFVLAAVLLATCSCTLLTHSPYLVQHTRVPFLQEDQGLIVSPSGHLPYQRWRIYPWDEELRYVWLSGNYDFRRSQRLELILYFHGMHSKDYYQVFRKELEALACKRPDRPFVFVGFVDTPYVVPPAGGKDRWNSLVPPAGERPDRLIQTVNAIYKAFRRRFPNVSKDKTAITLAGFSGGGRVLDAVAGWLARADGEDPYAEVFRARLKKMAYFDCWFGRDVDFIIPTLLENNPRMKIVGTVHMETPRKNALLLANRYNMKGDKEKGELVGLDGRLVIFRNDSHWSAMISRLKEAL